MRTQKPELYFGTKTMRIAPLGEASSLPDLSGVRILQNDLKFCLDEEDEIYEGYGRCKNAYPYRQYNNYTRTLEEGEVKTAVLENSYLKAVFLPEYGGRLWELWDKETGENILYTNDVLRFSNLAVRNAWFSGGVEWNIGVIGHTPLTTDPMYTAELIDDNGNPVLRMYEYERIRKVVYQMDFWMEEEQKNLYCRMRIVNAGSDVIPMYWWSNMAVPEYENGHIIVPAQEAFTYKENAVIKTEIPIVDGVDVTDYNKIPKSTDYFFHIPQEEPKYIANVNEQGYGLLQVSTKRLQSRKLFSWGHESGSCHWQEFLTDRAGNYVEIQAGLAKTQYGCLPMAPHTAWEWMEQYGPVKVEKEILEKPHTERAAYLTERLVKEHVPDRLEEKRIAAKAMAKREAKVVMKGSGYGALRSSVKGTEHLKFEIHEAGLLRWKNFLETGVLGKQNVLERPDEFCVDQENYTLLEKAVADKEKDNWYAWYLLGIGYYTAEKIQEAQKAFEKSWMLEENPWAAHGCAVSRLLLDRKEEASVWMERGIDMYGDDISYLKEGFKILSFCGAEEALCRKYEAMSPDKKKNGRLKLFYIQALHALGKNEEAYRLLEEDGGLLVDDIREGEDSLGKLWRELHVFVNGKEGEVPYIYNFRAS